MSEVLVPLAARIRRVAKRTAEVQRATSSRHAEIQSQPVAVTPSFTTNLDRRSVLRAIAAAGAGGLTLAACGAGEHNIDPSRYPPRTRVPETSSATTSQETAEPTTEATYTESDREMSIREQAKQIAQLTINKYNPLPSAAFRKRENVKDASGDTVKNVGKYIVSLNDGSFHERTTKGVNIRESRYYVLTATVDEDKNTGDPNLTKTPWQVTIGRKRGNFSPEKFIDSYTLTHVGSGNWCLTTTRAVSGQTNPETNSYYTEPDPNTDQVGFDDYAIQDLELINTLYERAKVSYFTGTKTPYDLPTFSPRY